MNALAPSQVSESLGVTIEPYQSGVALALYQSRSPCNTVKVMLSTLSKRVFEQTL